MSAPEHTTNTDTEHTPLDPATEDALIRHDARQQMVLGAANRDRTRTERGVSWAVWHFGEITATGSPALLGAVIDGRIAWLSLPIAAAWAGREAYQRYRAHTTTQARPAPREQNPAPSGTEDAVRREREEGSA